jgi:glycosyltransferase involved in cell wall biosynthesis
MFNADNRRRIRLAVVSTTPPRSCPVAAYTDELCRMLPAVAPRIALTVWAIDHGDGPPAAGGQRAAGSIPAADPSAYRRAGQRLHRLGVDVALLAVGPGTAGGPHGRYLLGLTDELTHLHVPYIVSLYGVRSSPLPDDADTLSALCRNAAGVIVASNSARRALAGSRIVDTGRVAVVPPGPAPELLVPSHGGTTPALATLLAGTGRGPVLTTMGHLSPARGIEVALAALPTVAAAYPNVRYVVAGRTLASQRRTDGERYRRTVVAAAHTLGVTDRLVLVDADLPATDTAALLHATDVYLAPDLDPGRTDHGPLGNAMAAGLRVVATANPYALETVGTRAGTVVPPGDPGALAAAITRVLAQPAPPAARHRSSIRTAEQIAGLVALVASPRPAPPERTTKPIRRHAA